MDLQRIKTKHIATQQEVTFEYHDPALDVDYPSSWFENHPTSRPTAVIPKYEGSDGDLARAVKGGIRSANLSVNTAKVFLYKYGANMAAHLAEDWTSFGVDIGIAGGNVIPWSVVSIQEVNRYVPPEPMIAPVGSGRDGASNPEDPLNWTDRALALYILCIYGLIKVTNEEYADVLVQRMGAQVSAEGGKGMTFHGTRNIYTSWANDKAYLKMVAAYDMFLYKFKDHPDSILRMGSLGSRFRDCTGLLSMGFAMSILNISAGELIDWVFVKTMGDEVLRITKSGQESGQADSYFPYQSDMGLITKSAYSTSANPYLFTWIHIAGSLIGHKRSQNARFIFEGSYSDIGLNAVLLTWVFARGGDMSPQFDSNGQMYGTEIEPEEEREDEADGLTPEDRLWVETQGRDPKTWFALLKAGGFRVPGVVRRSIRRQREKIKDAREQTVGAFCKDQLIY